MTSRHGVACMPLLRASYRVEKVGVEATPYTVAGSDSHIVPFLHPFPHSPSHRRIDDVVPVATFLLQRHVRSPGDMPWLDQSAITALREYGWPGNVRELENVLQRALVLAEDGVITANEILIDDALNKIAGGAQQAIGDAFRQRAAQA